MTLPHVTGSDEKKGGAMDRRIRSFVSVAIVCGCLLSLQWVYAQQTQPTEQKESSPPPSVQKEPPPEPIEKELSFLLGKWETKVKMYPNELLSIAEDVKGGGMAEYRLFGKTIEGMQKSESTVGLYEAKEFIFYNPSAKAYNIITINADGYVSNRVLTKVGKHYETSYEGKQIVPDASGKPGKEVEFTVNGKYKIVSDNEIHYNSEINFGNTGFKRFVRLQMTRVP
jgi:hypothetical protein